MILGSPHAENFGCTASRKARLTFSSFDFSGAMPRSSAPAAVDAKGRSIGVTGTLPTSGGNEEAGSVSRDSNPLIRVGNGVVRSPKANSEQSVPADELRERRGPIVALKIIFITSVLTLPARVKCVYE